MTYDYRHRICCAERERDSCADRNKKKHQQHLPSQFVDCPLLFDLLLFFLRKNSDGRFVGFCGWSAYTSLMDRYKRSEGSNKKNQMKKIKMMVWQCHVASWQTITSLKIRIRYVQTNRLCQVLLWRLFFFFLTQKNQNLSRKTSLLNWRVQQDKMVFRVWH